MFLQDEFVAYYKFQKIFDSFDIFMKRSMVDYFISVLGRGSLIYFTCIGPANQDHNNATHITLNDIFFSMKNNKMFNGCMSNVIEKYSVCYHDLKNHI